ncbi:MAG: VWA domain-containing protein [Nitrospinota bacterium]
MGNSEAFRSSSPGSYVFIVDDSFSMRTEVKEKNLFELATQFLSKLLDQIPEGSEFSLVLASSPAQVSQGWMAQKDGFFKLVQNQKPSFQTTDIGNALDSAVGLLKTSNNKEKEIILLTDLDNNGWDKEVISEIETLTNTPLKIYNFSSLTTSGNKIAVENVQSHQEFLSRSRILKIKAQIKNYSNENQRVPISLILDKKSVKEHLVNIQAGQTFTQEFSLPIRKGDPIKGEIRAGKDTLPTDSKRYFSHHPNQNIKVLVVDGDPGTISHQSESFYLERALNPFSVSLSHIDPTVTTLAELPLRKLSDFAVVILANVRELPVNFELELESFVLNGGSLIFGMGDQINARYYNQRLGNLLPVTLETVQNQETTHLLFKNNKHPVMEAFSPKAIDEMKEIPFRSIYTIQARDEKNFKVANWFSNQNPAVLETDFGKGKIILFLSSLDREWNDFPIQPTFLPWIQRWTQYAARGLKNVSHQNLLVGEIFNQRMEKGLWAIQAPGGIFHLVKSNEGQIRFNKNDIPGVYTVFELPENYTKENISRLPLGSEPVGTYTINVDTKESSSQKISEETIKSYLPNLKVSIKKPELDGTKSPTSEGVLLATPLFLLVAGILLLEGWMVRRE